MSGILQSLRKVGNKIIASFKGGSTAEVIATDENGDVAIGGDLNVTSIKADTINNLTLSGGNLGLDQPTPASENSTVRFLHIGNSTTAQSSIILEDNDGGGTKWEIKADGILSFIDGTDYRLRLTEGGWMGLGTGVGAIDAKLHVQNPDSTSVFGTDTSINRTLFKDSSGATTTGAGFALDFEGVFGGLGRIAVGKASGSTSGGTRDFGTMSFYTNADAGFDSYAAFVETLRLASGNVTIPNGNLTATEGLKTNPTDSNFTTVGVSAGNHLMSSYHRNNAFNGTTNTHWLPIVTNYDGLITISASNGNAGSTTFSVHKRGTSGVGVRLSGYGIFASATMTFPSAAQYIITCSGALNGGHAYIVHSGLMSGQI